MSKPVPKTIGDHFPDHETFLKAYDLAVTNFKFPWQLDRLRKVKLEFDHEGLSGALSDIGYEVLINLAYGEVDT